MKKLFTSLISMILVVVMAFGMTACNGGTGGVGGGDGEAPPVDEDGNVIVKIMFHVDKSSTEGQAYQKRINAFNTAYKDKGIKAQAIFKARSAGASGTKQSFRTTSSRVLLQTLSPSTRPTPLHMQMQNCSTISAI